MDQIAVLGGAMAHVLTKRMRQVLADNGETTKIATARKMNELGIIEITDMWVIRRGVPGQSATGIKSGTMVVAFKVNTDYGTSPDDLDGDDKRLNGNRRVGGVVEEK